MQGEWNGRGGGGPPEVTYWTKRAVVAITSGTPLSQLNQIEMGPHGKHQLSNKKESSKSVHPVESSERLSQRRGRPRPAAPALIIFPLKTANYVYTACVGVDNWSLSSIKGSYRKDASSEIEVAVGMLISHIFSDDRRSRSMKPKWIDDLDWSDLC
ncbi:hypothetical protein EVAR_102841_1 [Eumeta japonica]|uniref:Uncharacterized protein n=1 Tax=Eumeta variegata TaxID=151549 RepID=A0A4C1UMN8_EUMVA|nr:hypothetical protein EVAR_102841_1 [Eumeta japonica]